MREIKRVYQTKIGRKWMDEVIDTDPIHIYEWLTKDLIAKKINCCTYILSIKRVNNYDGTQTITVTYDHAGRNVFTIPC